MRRARADHWSFMFGEIALYSFAITLLTGVFLMVFFDPSMAKAPYDGSYAPLHGVPVSRAYESTLEISFDVWGGLLMRQVHHWAALIFVGAVLLQLLRMFLTGAFRRPRGVQWLIWIGVLVLGMAAGVTGGILPDDSLSAGSLGLIQGVVFSIPVIGTGLASLLFGGAFPGEEIIGRMYWAHLLISAALAGMLAIRWWLVRRHGHSRFAGQPRGPRPGRWAMLVPTTLILVLLGAFVQVTPVWLYGPARSSDTSAGAVPDWYMGFLDGALRIMPGWEFTIFGQTLSLAVLIPALIVPGAFFTVLALYPMVERRITGDTGPHHVLDRPRDAENRTATGMALVTFYVLLWAAASNDQIAHQFDMSLIGVTLFFRYAVLIAPILAYVLTRRICLGLQRRDREAIEHGRETGVIVQTPEGGFHEETMP